MSIYEKYQLRQVINASGKMTILGVSKYNQKAVEAQQFGNDNFFIMEELHEKVGAYIANLVGAEDAYVTSSASAGIAQAIAGIIGQGNLYHLNNPYTDRIQKREIVLPKGHNVDFGAPIETMIHLGGGLPVEAGFANKSNVTLVESVITEKTAALLYVKSHHAVQKDMISLEEMVGLAKKHQIPLIVDAAAEQDLTKYLAIGADLVVYSGSKALEGPTSGLVIGKKDLVGYARLQSHGIGRAMKVGKENILGLAAALEDYLLNGVESGESMKKRLAPFLDALNQVPGLSARMVQDGSGRDIYRAEISVHSAHISAKKLIEKLKEGDPAIYVREYQANNGRLEFDIRALNEAEMAQIINRLTQILKEN